MVNECVVWCGVAWCAVSSCSGCGSGCAACGGFSASVVIAIVWL